MRRLATALLVAVSVALLAGCPDRRGGESPSTAEGPAAGTRTSLLLITIDTLRSDHMGAYGYHRDTSPRIDGLARQGVLFEESYTYWPKTRGSFVAMMTGRLAAASGYQKTHPLLLDFNPTLASVLKDAGYETMATVDNANVAASLGFSRGFDRYRETWEEGALATEMDRTRAITGDGVRVLEEATPERPFFLWLHYVNPHTPYTPPPPFDTVFVDEEAMSGPPLAAVDGFFGGVHRPWEVPGKPLGFYVAQYDGEILTVDAEVGRLLDALAASEVAQSTLVVLTSDHGESLGEHDYFFEHGANLYDPGMKVPLIVAGPGFTPGTRSRELATTLDLVPTLLDAVKVSYPPGLSGRSLLPVVRGRSLGRERLPGQNDRNHVGLWDERFKIVGTPTGKGRRLALYDRETDPGETEDVSGRLPDRMTEERQRLAGLLEEMDAESARTRRLLEGRSGEERLSAEACEQLKAMGYIQDGCR